MLTAFNIIEWQWENLQRTFINIENFEFISLDFSKVYVLVNSCFTDTNASAPLDTCWTRTGTVANWTTSRRDSSISVSDLKLVFLECTRRSFYIFLRSLKRNYLHHLIPVTASRTLITSKMLHPFTQFWWNKEEYWKQRRKFNVTIFLHYPFFFTFSEVLALD